MLRLANISSGLAFPPYDGVCMFQSQHAHHCERCGYFRIDAMPMDAVLHLLRGGEVMVIDATRRRKPLSDALRFGVPTWCLVFNRAMGDRRVAVCEWETREMRRAAHSDRHHPTAQVIRRLARATGLVNGARAVVGKNVHLECHQGFIGDDKPRRIARMVAQQQFDGGLAQPAGPLIPDQDVAGSIPAAPANEENTDGCDV